MPLIKKLKLAVTQNPALKAWVHSLMFTAKGRPRCWVRHLLNPFLLHKGRGAVIRRYIVMNVSPVNDFRIGNRSVIEEFSVVDNGVGDVIIGHDTMVGLRNTLIGPVSIGSQVILAQNVVLSGLNHRYEDVDTPICEQGVETSPIIIGDGSWIGANSVITSGVRIGRHVVVAAGSVVTKDVEDYCVVAGAPAKVVKRYSKEEGVWQKV